MKGKEPSAAKESSSSSSAAGLNLAGFLFGNIDGDGKLSDGEHSFLDSDTRDKLGGLSVLLGSSGEEILKVRKWSVALEICGDLCHAAKYENDKLNITNDLYDFASGINMSETYLGPLRILLPADLPVLLKLAN